MRLSRLAASAAVLLAVTACSGDEDDPGVAAPTPAATASSWTEAPSPSPSPVVPTASLPPRVEGMRLTGDGIDASATVVTFGTPYDDVVAALSGALGEPTRDSGPIAASGDLGDCPGTTLRVLEYANGGLQLLFGDEGLHTWALTSPPDPGAVPAASALVGDEATFEFGPGTTVAQMEEGAGEAFAPTEDELSLDPGFTVDDQSSGFRGYLTGTTDGDTVTLVEAGAGCA